MPKSKFSIEITDFEGEVFGFIEKELFDEDAKVFFYLKSFSMGL